MWGTVGPTISFLQKETVPPSGTREKSPGPKSSFACLKLKCAPAPHQAFWDAPSPSPNLPSKKKGFTGEHGSPVKSRAARGAVPHCASAEAPRLGVQGAIRASCRTLGFLAPGAFLLDRQAARSLFGGEAATAHLGRAASAAFDAGSPCVGRPESIKLKGPPLRCAQWGTKENGGAGGSSRWEEHGRGLWPQKSVRPRCARNLSSPRGDSPPFGGFISSQRPHLSLSRLRRQLPRQRAPCKVRLRRGIFSGLEPLPRLSAERNAPGRRFFS